MIDALLEKLPPGRRQAGWDTAGTALGALAVTTPSYLEGTAASPSPTSATGTSCKAPWPMQRW